MKKETVLVLMMLAAFSLLAVGCGEGKYMLSGTWYSDEGETTPAYVFYDSGSVKIGDSEMEYEMTGTDAMVIYRKDFEQTAILDRDMNEIMLLDADGKECSRLYKAQSAAAAAFVAKADMLSAAMEDTLTGSWSMKNGEVTMSFDQDKCTMVTVHKGEPVKTVYQVAYPEAGKIQFISSGNEVVAEFDVKMSDGMLTFTDEDENVTKYVRKEG